MAQKAQKSQAARNTARLNQTHIITLAVHVFYHLLRLILVRRSLYKYLLLSLPGLLVEFWFERTARPTYLDTVNGKELKRAGEDLDAKGLTEWMWDVLYWSWFCLAIVTIVGDWAWWLYLAVPVYSAWLAYSTFSGARKGLMGGAMPADGAADGTAAAQGTSKRQQKLEKRGGQRVQYR